MRHRLLGAVAAGLLAVAALAGCSEAAPQLPTGGVQNGAVTEYKNPGAPVSFSGPTVDGGRFSSASALGHVLVVNFWYAGCAPCRAEAKALQSIATSTAKSGVMFVGVNVRDEAGLAKSFDGTFGVTYPSILDSSSGAVQLAFSDNIRPNATPTTLVLDSKGRVRASILGELPDPSILTTLITSVQQGGS